MTVQELIEKLKEFDQTLEVKGFEVGGSELKNIVEIFAGEPERGHIGEIAVIYFMGEQDS